MGSIAPRQWDDIQRVEQSFTARVREQMVTGHIQDTMALSGNDLPAWFVAQESVTRGRGLHSLPDDLGRVGLGG